MPNTVVAYVKYEVLSTAALISYFNSTPCCYNKKQREKLCFWTKNSNKRKNVKVEFGSTENRMSGCQGAPSEACIAKKKKKKKGHSKRQNSQHPARYGLPSTSSTISLNVTLATRLFYPNSGWDKNPHSTVIHAVPRVSIPTRQYE